MLASFNPSRLTRRNVEFGIDRAVDNPSLKAALPSAKGCHQLPDLIVLNELSKEATTSVQLLDGKDDMGLRIVKERFAIYGFQIFMFAEKLCC